MKSAHKYLFAARFLDEIGRFPISVLISFNRMLEICLLMISSDCVCEYLRVSVCPVLRERGDSGSLLLPQPSEADCLDGS